MKIVIINKSDTLGGAAVVSRRLLEALRERGEDAELLVAERLSDSPFVIKAAPDYLIKWKFLLDRLKIFIANGFNRKTLFKIDTGEEGLSLWKHPVVKDADVIMVQWINQGFLSLKGLNKILSSGKTVIWTMHDMWNMTGICHHAGTCKRFQEKCGECPLLGKRKSVKDLSFKIWRKKKTCLSNKLLSKNLHFVSVSNWLKNKALESSLLKDRPVEVIGNPYKFPDKPVKKENKNQIKILYGAARLDDPIKGLEILKISAGIIKDKYPELAERLLFVMFGGIKNPENIEGFPLRIEREGIITDEKNLASLYKESDIVVSASSYETFGYTLLEGQAYGVIPVSFSQGGQIDIISHKETGYLAEYDDDKKVAAANLAEGIIWACEIIQNPEKFEEIQKKMRKEAGSKFSYDVIATKYVSLIEKLHNNS